MDPITQINENAKFDFAPVVGDFNTDPIISASELSDHGKRMLEAYAPALDAVDWFHSEKGIAGPKGYQKKFLDTYKLLTAQMLHMITKMPASQIRQESMLAGTDATTYNKQILRTVLRAFPKLIAPQLVPVVPMTGPTARVYFELLKYDTTFVSSSPNVAVGDTMDDLTKFNSGYAAQAAQLTDMNGIKLSLENYLDVTEGTYGLSATSSLQFEDDIATVHGRNYDNYISDRLASMLQWFIDRRVIGAVTAAVPSGNKVYWARKPSINGVAWANQLPSEKNAHRETIWRDGFVPAMTKIYNNRYEFPNWCVCGSNAAEDIRGLSVFQPLDVYNADSLTIHSGAVRDLGMLNSGEMRVLLDPQMDPNLIILGVRPTDEFKPAVVWCPYRPIGFAPDLFFPKSLKHEKGAYTRYGIAQPTNGNTESARLGYSYASITISDQ